MRKIIQIEAIPEGEGTYAGVFALCDDGEIFYSRGNSKSEWVRLPKIPQDGDKNESNT